MKMMGRRHRPFFRVCVTDARTPRDGRVIEEVGYYDPMVPETDARAVLNNERIDYWVSVGAQLSDKVAVLVKKYGSKGTHLDAQKAANELLARKRRRPTVPTELPPALKTKSKKEKAAEAAKAAEAVEAKAQAAVEQAVAENS
jgi:small subunit ribosomal protein S16